MTSIRVTISARWPRSRITGVPALIFAWRIVARVIGGSLASGGVLTHLASCRAAASAITGSEGYPEHAHSRCWGIEYMIRIWLPTRSDSLVISLREGPESSFTSTSKTAEAGPIISDRRGRSVDNASSAPTSFSLARSSNLRVLRVTSNFWAPWTKDHHL